MDQTQIPQDSTQNPAAGIPQTLQALEARARQLGASRAIAIPSTQVPVQDRLAELCLPPKCPNYGKAASCPPHVSGPAGFRSMVESHPYALVVRVEMPARILFSMEALGAAQNMHTLVAGVEQAAKQLGFTDSKGFASGSCKPLFCAEEDGCQELRETGTCLHPDEARPSMSGFGIDVSVLMQNCGWSDDISLQPPKEGEERMSWLAGLVLVG